MSGWPRTPAGKPLDRAMNGPFDELVAVFADAVARRVVELQNAEAVQHRVSYLTPAAMAERMGLTVKTLANQRSARRGPPFVKVGGAVRYPVNGA